MTREQAIRIAKDGGVGDAGFIDTLTTLGVLKLDPPKDAQDEFLGKYFAGTMFYYELRQKLFDAGCKIVKK